MMHCLSKQLNVLHNLNVIILFFIEIQYNEMHPTFLGKLNAILYAFHKSFMLPRVLDLTGRGARP